MTKHTLDDVGMYIEELEACILNAAAIFGGNPSPALAAWMAEHKPLIRDLRKKHKRALNAKPSSYYAAKRTSE